MTADLMAQAKELEALVGLFPPATGTKKIRRTNIQFRKVHYVPAQNKAVVVVQYYCIAKREEEFAALADYWAEVQQSLGKSTRLGEQVKLLLCFRLSMAEYYAMDLAEQQQRQYSGLFNKTDAGLQRMINTVLSQARAQEEEGRVYKIVLAVGQQKSPQESVREARNFDVLEDRLFLDQEYLRDLTNFLYGKYGRKADHEMILTGLVFHRPLSQIS